MTDKIEALSFHVEEDFKITYGKNKKPVSIPRLNYKNSQKLVKIIAELLSKNASAVLKLIASQMENKSLDPKVLDKNSKLVETITQELIVIKDFVMIKEMLLAVSEGSVKESMIDEMQYAEAVSLLSFLLDRNFGPLKNLSASLGAIYSSVKTENA